VSDLREIVWLDGGVCAPRGFVAAGVRCSLKQSGLDLGLLASEVPCPAAGMFTTNTLPGWPVVLSRQALADGGAFSGIVVNSGVSNVATGEAGLALADEMRSLARAAIADRLGAEAGQVLIAQTGVIGELPDAAKIRTGVKLAGLGLSRAGGPAFAEAIMTTDTRPKIRACEARCGAGTFRIGGSAKGAGMIAPRMATMLAFVTTDAKLTSAAARGLLVPAVNRSFNRVTVDGDTSTSDSVFLLANGVSGVDPAVDRDAGAAFADALSALCEALALDLVRDAEGATRVCKIEVCGAATDADALVAARTIAESPLVKTALFGADPNWGRIWAALGRSGARTDPARLSISIGGTPVLDRGTPCPGGKAAAAAKMLQPEVTFMVDLGLGSGAAHYWFSDLSDEYVRINADYHT